MSNRIKALGQTYQIANANFYSWLYSTRTITMLIFAAIIVWSDSLNAFEFMNYHPVKLHWSEAVCWQLSRGGDMLTLGVLFLVTITEIPSRTAFHTFSLLRSKRSTWLLGQILYCFYMAFFFVIIIAVLYPVFMRFLFISGVGWSEAAPIKEGTLLEADALIRGLIREKFNPLSGALISAVPLVIFFFVMSLTVMSFSFLGFPMVGPLIYMFLLLAQQVIQVELIPWLKTPMKYATLSNILGREPLDSPNRITETAIVYFSVTILMFIVLRRRVRTIDLHY